MILATHSPTLLDQFDVEEIRVVEHDGLETRVAYVSTPQIEAICDKLLDPGELLTVDPVRIQLEASVASGDGRPGRYQGSRASVVPTTRIRGVWPGRGDPWRSTDCVSILTPPPNEKRPGRLVPGALVGRDPAGGLRAGRGEPQPGLWPLSARGGACARAGNGCRTGRTAAPW